MQTEPPFPYRLAASLAPGIAGRILPSARPVLAARQESRAALLGWARVNRDRARPCLVVHGASAGELRQAEPVIRRLRSKEPRWQIVATHFSPSGAAVAADIGADAAGFFPWDTAGEVASFLDELTPTAIAWCKHDLWPHAALLAHQRGIHLGMFAATVRKGSHRLRWPVRALLEPAYAALESVGAVSREDADALVRMGVRHGRIEVTGDPRYDAVLERIASRQLPDGSPDTLVAGSTWPQDEGILLTAFRQVIEQHPSARLVLVPHRPSDAGWHRLCAQAATLGLPAPVPLEEARGDEPMAIGRRVGGLAFDYCRGGIAYVGGGFRRGGVHSVLEPAACGRPVLAGPHARDSRDARALNKVEALEFLPRRRAAAVLEAWWVNWARDEEWRARAGQAARDAVEARRGAAERSAALLRRLIGAT